MERLGAGQRGRLWPRRLDRDENGTLARAPRGVKREAARRRRRSRRRASPAPQAATPREPPPRRAPGPVAQHARGAVPAPSATPICTSLTRSTRTAVAVRRRRASRGPSLGHHQQARSLGPHLERPGLARTSSRAGRAAPRGKREARHRPQCQGLATAVDAEGSWARASPPQRRPGARAASTTHAGPSRPAREEPHARRRGDLAQPRGSLDVAREPRRARPAALVDDAPGARASSRPGPRPRRRAVRRPDSGRAAAGRPGSGAPRNALPAPDQLSRTGAARGARGAHVGAVVAHSARLAAGAQDERELAPARPGARAPRDGRALRHAYGFREPRDHADLGAGAMGNGKRAALPAGSRRRGRARRPARARPAWTSADGGHLHEAHAQQLEPRRDRRGRRLPAGARPRRSIPAKAARLRSGTSGS